MRAHVRLEQPGADDDERQPGVEERQRVKDEREVADRDDDAADQHAPYWPSQRSAMMPPKIAKRPGARGVRAVHGTGVLVVEVERVDHVQDEERPHPVVAEALPHLGEEERGEPARVTEEAAGFGAGGV